MSFLLSLLHFNFSAKLHYQIHCVHLQKNSKVWKNLFARTRFKFHWWVSCKREYVAFDTSFAYGFGLSVRDAEKLSSAKLQGLTSSKTTLCRRKFLFISYQWHTGKIQIHMWNFQSITRSVVSTVNRSVSVKMPIIHRLHTKTSLCRAKFYISSFLCSWSYHFTFTSYTVFCSWKENNR